MDVTREFSKETRAEVSNTPLKAEATASGVRIGLGGACGWGDGRYALRGAAGYTAADGGNGTYGGGLNLAVRF